MEKKSLTVSGLSSVRALAEHTPEIIERLFFDEASAALFSAACRYLAQARKIYRLVSSDELKKITDTAHHQGAAAVITVPATRSLGALSLSSPTLCLHDLKNPHNVGAIIRTAAFFGIEAIVMSQPTYDAAQTQAAWRVAEGGMTHVTPATYKDESELFSWIKTENMRALAAVKPGPQAMRSLGEFLRDKNKGLAVICLGNEEEGLTASFVAQCGARFAFTGSGKIESLNVSAVAALCLNMIRPGG